MKVLDNRGAQIAVEEEKNKLRDEKFRSVLTAEQFKIYIDEHIKKYVNLWSFLSLTTDQKDKILSIEVELYKKTSEKILKALDNLNVQIEILLEMNKIQEERYKMVLNEEQFKQYQEVNDFLRRKKLEQSSRIRYDQ